MTEGAPKADDNIYKIFCDESCHLQHDGADVMVLGALCCSMERAKQLTKHIKWLRHKHNYLPELKWTKLNKHEWEFYRDILDMFFDAPDVCFKATVVLEKKTLNHQEYNSGSHSDFYYKMFYYTLRDFLVAGNQYRIYLDYMDTLGAEKTKKMCEVLRTGAFNKLQVEATIVHSYEAQLIQVVDLFIGAVAYKNRNDIEKQSAIKNQFVSYLEDKIASPLDYATPPWERKFNIFRFKPRS